MKNSVIIKGTNFSRYALDRVSYDLKTLVEVPLDTLTKTPWVAMVDSSGRSIALSNDVTKTNFDAYIVPVTAGEKYAITSSLQENQPPVVSLKSNVMSETNVDKELIPHGSTSPCVWDKRIFTIPSNVSYILIQQVNSNYPGFPVLGYELKLWKYEDAL